MNIILIEDNLELGGSLLRVLVKEGWKVMWLRLYEDAKRNILDTNPDLIILDLTLPDGNGEDLLQWIYERRLNSAVVVVTARDDIRSKINLLDGGADDYLVKPFLVEELISRIRAIMRRIGVHDKRKSCCNIELDESRYTASINGNKITLPPKEFSILKLLVINAGRVVSKKEILDSIFMSHAVSSNSLEVHLHNLRKRIGSDYIKNIRGIGYVIEDNEEE
ncbi:response regulator transcription factor [Aeromonas caviae]|uniref:response regulator transcription factor n=1 Tax=Aeromonas caviae TaxID=648 RepID=UPI0038D175DC